MASKRSNIAGNDRRGKRLRCNSRAVDDDYFKGYSGIEIHEQMLKDQVRTKAYREAIFENRSRIEGKAVLDVGCGTGILSLFARDVGARVVYAVDASDMADYARKIVEVNGASDVIKVIRGKIEEIELPEKVDVIISEWMGYFLVYETMLSSVIFARNRWMRPDGIMLPTEATLFLGAFSWPEKIQEHIGCWRRMYGYDFTPLLPLASRSLIEEPIVEILTPQQEVTESEPILHLDLRTVEEKDLVEWKANATLKAIISARVYGVFAWFEVQFPRSKPDTKERISKVEKEFDDSGLILSTSPEDEPTHWAQTIFFFDNFPLLEQDDRLETKLNVKTNAQNPRLLDIEVSWRHQPDTTRTSRNNLKEVKKNDDTCAASVQTPSLDWKKSNYKMQ